jgi:hypothetical protein
MKIESFNPADRSQGSPSPVGAKAAESGQSQNAFGEALAKALTLEPVDSKAIDPAASKAVKAVTELSKVSAIETDGVPGQQLTMQAEQLLDRLTQYQQMLADPSINLKQMRSTVEHLIDAQKNLSEDLPQFQGSVELKEILNSLLVSTTLEIEKFSGGFYA